MWEKYSILITCVRVTAYSYIQLVLPHKQIFYFMSRPIRQMFQNRAALLQLSTSAVIVVKQSFTSELVQIILIYPSVCCFIANLDTIR